MRLQPAAESQETTAKELLRQRIDELSEAEAESALRLIDARRKGENTSEAGEPEMGGKQLVAPPLLWSEVPSVLSEMAFPGRQALNGSAIAHTRHRVRFRVRSD